MAEGIRSPVTWIADNATTNGASLAFFCAFSIAPLLVIVLTTGGWIVGATAALSQIGAQLTALFGPPVGVRGWIQTRFLSLGFILTLGFLLLVSLTVSTGLSTIQRRIGEQHPVWVGALGAADLAVSISLIGFLFAVIFRYLPARRLPWKTVAVGGLLTAVLFDVGRWGGSLYLAHSTQPSAFGAAASFATLLLWLYYTSIIFLYGAEYTACLGGLRKEPDQDVAHNTAKPAQTNTRQTTRSVAC